MRELRLLAVFAHPDDESFGPGGTLARYARQGVAVHVCTVTDGAAGLHDTNEPRTDERPPLAPLRRQELECACQVLGVRLHLLGYRDSGMAGLPDNQHPDSLYQAHLDDVARDLVRVIHDVRPNVVITHDPTGGYFHPDHIRVNAAVCLAWDRAADLSAYPELEADASPIWQPARLYYTVIPQSSVKWFLRILRLMRRDPRRFGQNRDIDLTQIGMPDDQIHVRIDVGQYLAQKEQASACHSSQGGSGALRLVPAFLRHRMMRYEHFVQVQPPDAGPHGDLFDGLDVG